MILAIQEKQKLRCGSELRYVKWEANTERRNNSLKSPDNEILQLGTSLQNIIQKCALLCENRNKSSPRVCGISLFLIFFWCKTIQILDRLITL